MLPGKIKKLIKINKMELETEVISIIKESINYNFDIKLTDRLIEDLGIDSLEKLILVDNIEEKYSIMVEDEDEVKNLETVADIVELLRNNI